MKIVFFGTPSFVDPVLKILQENFEVAQIIRHPQAFDGKFISQLKSLNPDIFVVSAYGQILPKSLLEVPTLGTINIHPSLLPKYRGASPIQNAILNGDKKTGVTFIKMDEEVDHGPIIKQFEVEILPTDTFESLAKKLFELAANKILEVLDANQSTPQDDSKATFTQTLTRQDGYIDLSIVNNKSSMVNLEKMIRAYFPWPGVWFKHEINGKEVIIKLLPQGKIQVEGKSPMSYKDFANGYSEGNEILKSLNLVK